MVVSGVGRFATGRENLELQDRIQGMGGRDLRSRADELLELVGIADAANRVVRGYSGGMKRRLDVAMGLVHRPPSCSSTSPRPASTRKRASRCGPRSAGSHSRSR